MQIFMIYLGNFLYMIFSKCELSIATYMDTSSLHMNFQTVVTFKIVDAKCKRTKYLDLFTPLESVF